MNLRPHHILCIQKFSGHGYNETFTFHMQKVVNILKEDPLHTIYIKKGCDDLCERCPNNINNKCSTLDKVALMDNKVIEICNLNYNKNYIWNDIKNNVKETILKTDKFNDICKYCEWFDLCLNTEVNDEV